MAATEWAEQVRHLGNAAMTQQQAIMEEQRAAKQEIVYDNAGQEPDTPRSTLLQHVFGYAIGVWLVIVVGVMVGYVAYNGMCHAEGRHYDGTRGGE